jgi:hypothetical protein
VFPPHSSLIFMYFSLLFSLFVSFIISGMDLGN